LIEIDHGNRNEWDFGRVHGLNSVFIVVRKRPDRWPDQRVLVASLIIGSSFPLQPHRAVSSPRPAHV
jgi:hypothetical protein